MTVSESPFSSVCFTLHMEPLSLFLDFCFFFSSVFVPLYDLGVVNRKKIQTIREILNDKSMRHRKVYSKSNVTYAAHDNQLRCFVSKKQTRKILFD